MDFAKLADHLCHSTASLSVRDIVILTPEADFQGHGKLMRDGQHIELEIVLGDERELPTIGGRTYSRDEFWKIGGVIEGHVPFWAVSLPHQNTYHSSRFITVRSANFDCDNIEHLTLPFEDGGMREAIIKAATTQIRPVPALPGNEAFARLVEYKLVWSRGETVTTIENGYLRQKTITAHDTLQGKFGDFDYALIQRKEDCEVHVRRAREESDSAPSMQSVMAAMLHAVAFLHGSNAWPQWQRIEIDEDGADEFATAPRKVGHTIHTLLTKRTCQGGSDPTLLINKALECFLREDEFSESLNHYLFLAREASAEETPNHVGVLGLCAVFEGLVNFLHAHFCTLGLSQDDSSFNKVRSELAEYAAVRTKAVGIENEERMSWKRFIGRIQSAISLRPIDKYRRLVEHFGLPMEKLSGALTAWKEMRNPLAHGNTPDAGFGAETVAVSRIAGAINILCAAAIGYSGLAVLSRIEDLFIRLPDQGAGLKATPQPPTS